MHGTSASIRGERPPLADDPFEPFVFRYLPGDRHILPDAQNTRPQHEAIWRRVARCHTEREGIPSQPRADVPNPRGCAGMYEARGGQRDRPREQAAPIEHQKRAESRAK